VDGRESDQLALWAVGSENGRGVVYRLVKGRFYREVIDTLEVTIPPLNAVWVACNAPKRVVWVAGKDGIIYKHEDSRWSRDTPYSVSMPAPQLRSIWGYPDGSATWIGGDFVPGGAAAPTLLERTAETTWTWMPVSIASAAGSQSFVALSGLPNGTVWVVGTGPQAFYRDTKTKKWTFKSPAFVDYTGAHVAGTGALVTVDAGGCFWFLPSPMASPTSECDASRSYRAVWSMNGARAWALDAAGPLVVAEHGKRVEEKLQPAATLTSIFGTTMEGLDILWIVGRNGSVIRYVLP
jgi:hypothetical protein